MPEMLCCMGINLRTSPLFPVTILVVKVRLVKLSESLVFSVSLKKPLADGTGGASVQVLTPFQRK